MFDKTISVRGIHATYWKELSAGVSESAGPNPRTKFKLFDRYMDAFFVAPLLGCLYNRKGTNNLTSIDDEASIQANIVIKYSQILTSLLRTVILVENSSDLSKEDRIERAFRGDNDPQVSDENMKLFMEYVYGGLEILHEKFAEAITDDDFINEIHEIVDQFYRDMNIDKIEESLAD